LCEFHHEFVAKYEQDIEEKDSFADDLPPEMKQWRRENLEKNKWLVESILEKKENY